MYTVEWCNHEGNLEKRQFETLEDAQLEAVELDKKYDGAHILDQNGNEVIF